MISLIPVYIRITQYSTRLPFFFKMAGASKVYDEMQAVFIIYCSLLLGIHNFVD